MHRLHLSRRIPSNFSRTTIFCSTNDDLNAIDKTSNLHNCKSLLNKNIAVNENKTERGGRVFFPF